MKTLTLALAFCALQQDRPAPTAPPFTFQVETFDGEAWCTIQSERAPVRDLLAELAREVDVEVEGLADVPADALVTVDLRRRPLNQALVWILGSTGLRLEQRVHTWTVQPLLSAAPDIEELRDQAMVAYLRASRAFPKHAQAAAAERSQALIQEARGNLAAARTHYDALAENHAGSHLVPEALLRSGEILAHTGQWAQAGQRFEQLLRLEREHPYEARARTELARSTANQGDWQRALHMVDALDANVPPTSEAELIERTHVRVHALIDAEDLPTAKALLDQVERRRLTRSQRRRTFELRATLYERAGEKAQAGRALLALSQELEGLERLPVLERAARFALESGDELGALMAVGHIEASDLGAEAEAVARSVRTAAREALGLELPVGASRDAEQRLNRGERLVAAGMHSEAIGVLQPLLLQGTPLAEEALTRVLLAIATSQARVVDVDTAVAGLREGLHVVQDAERRRRIYVLAGELYEKVERLDEAADAYRGRL